MTISTKRIAVTLSAGLVLGACAALGKAAPTLLDITEQVLEHELAAARDEQQEADVRRALALLEETRRAQEAAEDAAAQAEKAAQEARDAATVAEAHRQAAEARATAARAESTLALAIQSATRKRASEAYDSPDAGVDAPSD